MSMIKIADRLKDLINDVKNEEDLIAYLQLSDSSILRAWLREDVYPNFSYLIKLADYFRVSLEYLIGRTEDNSEQKFKECPPFDLQLKKLMKEKNKTQYRMAKDKLASPDHFYKWFTKKSQPRLETLIKLADYFDVSIDYLVGRE